MAIQIPSFENVEAKIEWLREQIATLAQDHENPALEADRLTLVSSLNAALDEAGIDPNPEPEKPYIPPTVTTG